MNKVKERYSDILNEYEKKRDASRRDLELRIKRMYEKLPSIKEIDDTIAFEGLRITKLVLDYPDAYFKEVKKYEESIKKLLSKKEEILEANSYPKNFLEISYSCNNCKDTGYIDGKKCACFEQKIIDRNYNQSNIKDMLRHENFDCFNLNYYSDRSSTKHEISPLQNIREILNIAVDFAKDFGSIYSNLLLYGKTGIGKTFVCNCIAKDILDRGFTVLYYTASQLFQIIENIRFKKYNYAEYEYGFIETLFDVDLLIIDDLGTEFSSSFTVSELFNIINLRNIRRKSVIITTNLDIKNLQDIYTDRIVSRIMGEYKMLKFYGDDIRVKRAFDL